MYNSDIDLLHEKYSSFFNEYHLVGSSDIWIPFFKKDIEVTYISEENLTVAEEFVGKCIQRGINRKADIAKVLTLKANFLNVVIEPLLEQNFLVTDDKNESIYLSDEGEKLFARKIKCLNKKGNLSILFDVINETNKVEYLAYERKGFSRVREAKDGILIDGRKFPVYEHMKDYERLSKYFLTNIEMHNKNVEKGLNISKIVNVKDFEYMPRKELLFRKYAMLIYADTEKELEVLVIDSVTKIIQPEFSAVLKKRLVEGYFSDYFDIATALEERDNVLNELSEIADKIEKLDDEKVQITTVNNVIILKYLMNTEIRRLFLHYLETAQKSLYIISPWLNRTIVNDAFKKSIEKLLKCGVEIRILYGITDGNEVNFSGRDKKSKEIADELRNLGKKYNGLLKIENEQTHEKLLICDDKYVINGSYNFLSYDAEYKGDLRKEGSTFIESEEWATEVIKARFTF
ncbi:phospholipase D-like domain-containing protein [Carnobacterium jeotgali]|uniref:phospholipase D-like domain-containing protein n=1 Tax=Carnobacterium jeotgali TaxID=545534 RepID=UPI000493AAB4|nr:phospholipase D-like domain-containing protein [Carnobacterium jeotgali]